MEKMENMSVIISIITWRGFQGSRVNPSDRGKMWGKTTEGRRVAKPTFQCQSKENIFREVAMERG